MDILKEFSEFQTEKIDVFVEVILEMATKMAEYGLKSYVLYGTEGMYHDDRVFVESKMVNWKPKKLRRFVVKISKRLSPYALGEKRKSCFIRCKDRYDTLKRNKRNLDKLIAYEKCKGCKQPIKDKGDYCPFCGTRHGEMKPNITQKYIDEVERLNRELEYSKAQTERALSDRDIVAIEQQKFREQRNKLQRQVNYMQGQIDALKKDSGSAGLLKRDAERWRNSSNKYKHDKEVLQSEIKRLSEVLAARESDDTKLREKNTELKNNIEDLKIKAYHLSANNRADRLQSQLDSAQLTINRLGLWVKSMQHFRELFSTAWIAKRTSSSFSGYCAIYDEKHDCTRCTSCAKNYIPNKFLFNIISNFIE
jgi:hypothetical protein